jgi:hypothetical protein
LGAFNPWCTVLAQGDARLHRRWVAHNHGASHTGWRWQWRCTCVGGRWLPGCQRYGRRHHHRHLAAIPAEDGVAAVLHGAYDERALTAAYTPETQDWLKQAPNALAHAVVSGTVPKPEGLFSATTGWAFSQPSKRAGLFMAQCLDRVHAGRTAGRKIAKHHANSCRKHQRKHVDGHIKRIRHRHVN